MPKFWVHVRNQVSTSVPVEADTVEAALEAVYDADDMPGGITVGAFGPQPVDDDDWYPVEVTTDDGETVWSEDKE